jgi:SAM-dependent methyltransferase
VAAFWHSHAARDERRMPSQTTVRASPAIPLTVRAFDRLSDTYDTIYAGEILQAMRARTNARMAATFPPGSRVLEIGCGTGLDTAFLTSRGVDVVAADPSAGMIHRARARVRASNGIAHLIRCGVDELDQHLGTGTFDGIVSNFGALDCVPRLDGLGRLARTRLTLGGCLVLGLMAPTCPWEMAHAVLRGRPRAGFGRWGPAPVMVGIGDVAVATYYHRVADVMSALGSTFKLRRIEGLGVIVPPHDLEQSWRRLPAPLRRAAYALDGTIGRLFPFNRVGDFLLLEIRRQSGGSEGAGWPDRLPR